MSVPPEAETTGAVAVWRRLAELAERRRCDDAQLARDLGLPPSQLLALLHLDPDAPQPMSRLAGALACDKGNVTGIVDRLEGRGLVARRPDPADRRVKVLALTPAGARLRGEAARRRDAPPPALAKLDDTELARLADVLDRIVEDPVGDC